MSMSYEDAARDMAITDLHSKAVWERAKREQCIFLLIEGHSEEVAFPILLEEYIDLDELGIVTAGCPV